MDIQILQLTEGARKARGLTVVIDVFRAFTVECYAAAWGVGEILPVKDVETAFQMKAENPHYLLMGERGGKMVPGFDFGNSPSRLDGVPLTGKTLVHTTSAGTQGIANASNAKEILTGSLVNAKAIARYIQNSCAQDVSLVCMGLAGREETEEDTLCAEYIRSLLEGHEMDIRAQMEKLKYTSGAKFFDPAQEEAFPQADFDYCIQLNRFPFVLKVHPCEKWYRVEKIDL